MTVWNVLLFIFGALAAIVLLCLAVIWFEKKAPEEAYDERQKIDRGNACQLSSCVSLVYLLYVFVCLEMDYAMPFGTGTMILIGILLDLQVFHIYCVLKRSALPLGQKGWGTAITYGILCITNLLRYGMHVDDVERYAQQLAQQGSALPGGYTDRLWQMLFIAVDFGVLAILHLISILWKERE